MPIKGSKSLAKKNSHLGQFQVNKKILSDMEEKIEHQLKLISEARLLLSEIEKEL